jgi:hypothetical protein
MAFNCFVTAQMGGFTSLKGLGQEKELKSFTKVVRSEPTRDTAGFNIFLRGPPIFYVSKSKPITRVRF